MASIGPLCSLVEILVFVNKFASLCSLVVEILVFLNKFAPLCSLRCLVGPVSVCWQLSCISVCYMLLAMISKTLTVMSIRTCIDVIL